MTSISPSAECRTMYTNTEHVDPVADFFAQLSLEPEQSKRGWVVDNVIRPRLDATDEENRLITAADPCFAPALEFRKRWGIKPRPWENFVRLLCGYRHFPIVLLQNPSKEHNKTFEEMKACPTIDWISAVLKEIGLSLDEVPVMDICPLFSDGDLRAIGDERRDDAVESAYRLTEEMLEILQPSVMLCCQCVTLGRRRGDGVEVWKPAENALARQLCSSTRGAKEGDAIPIDMGNHQVWAVQGFHPCRLSYQTDPQWTLILEAAFRDIFQPCARWEASRLARAFEDLINATDRVISALHAFIHASEHRRPEDGLEEVCSRLLTIQRDFRDSLSGVVGGLVNVKRS